MTSIEAATAATIARRLSAARAAILGKGFTRQRLKAVEQNYSKLLREAYWLVQPGAAGETEIFVAYSGKADLGDATIRVVPFFLNPERAKPQRVRRLLKDMAKHLHGNQSACRFDVMVLPHQTQAEHCLNKLGFRPDAIEFTGQINKSLRYLKGKAQPLPPGMRFRLMRKADMNAVLRLDKLAHNNSPTSRIKMHNRTAVQKMREYYEFALKRPHRTHLLYDRSKLIGLMSVFFKDGRGAIGSLTLHPDYQGQGLSHNLYQVGLTTMAEAGCKEYLGGSTTDVVLRNAANMGRVKHATWLKGRI